VLVGCFAVCFCVAYVVVIRKREAAEDVAALAAAHAAGETMGRKGNMDLSFLRQVRPEMTGISDHVDAARHCSVKLQFSRGATARCL
jgi:hypothetical protein